MASFGHVEDHQIAAVLKFGDLARGGLGLFMPMLAMDHRSEAVPSIRLDPLPDIEHRAAGSIDQHGSDGAKGGEILDRDAERRENHHVIGGDPREIEVALIGSMDELDAHGLEFLVDMGIVDDLTDHHELAGRKLGPGFVGVLDRPVDSVAEPELLGEPEGQRANRQPMPVRLERLDETAVIVGRQGAFDGPFQPESLTEIGLIGHAANASA